MLLKVCLSLFILTSNGSINAKGSLLQFGIIVDRHHRGVNRVGVVVSTVTC